MSTFKIFPDSFLRLVNIISFFESSISDDSRNLLKTIRLENRKGHRVAVATNGKIAAVEYLGPTTDPDGFCHLKIPDNMIQEVKLIESRNEHIVVTVIPEIAMATAQIGIGGIFLNDACHWFDKTPLDEWTRWFVQAPTVSTGIMCWDTFHVDVLLRSSPSGKVVFPEFIDANRPVVLRDRYQPQSWMGVFLPSDKLTPDLTTEVKNRYMPEWIK